VKTVALFFHKQSQQACAREEHQLVPYVGWSTEKARSRSSWVLLFSTCIAFIVCWFCMGLWLLAGASSFLVVVVGRSGMCSLGDRMSECGYFLWLMSLCGTWTKTFVISLLW
jgi:hypothetical protein